jgi:hypothetical protein
MTAMALGLLLASAGAVGLWAGAGSGASVPPTLAQRLKGTHWLLVVVGAGLIAHGLLPLRSPRDLPAQEIVLGPFVTVAGVVGVWLHTLRARDRSKAVEESMWALRSKAGLFLCIPIGIWMTVHGLMHRFGPPGR